MFATMISTVTQDGEEHIGTRISYDGAYAFKTGLPSMLALNGSFKENRKVGCVSL